MNLSMELVVMGNDNIFSSFALACISLVGGVKVKVFCKQVYFYLSNFLSLIECKQRYTNLIGLLLK